VIFHPSQKILNRSILKFNSPPDVADAQNIFRHEEVERFRKFGNPCKDPEWASGKARKVADGFLDRRKQSALYVAISKIGEVGLHPGLITRLGAVKIES
jgi:hypothetical protein